MTHDDDYPHADLVAGYLARRGVKTFHVRKADTPDTTACGRDVADLIAAGWARHLRRRGLTLCSKCSSLIDLDAPLETDGGDE